MTIEKRAPVILFIGGARSGKSALAERIAAQYSEVAYIATAEAIDQEMRERIEQHRQSRPNHWVTFEVDGSLCETLVCVADEARDAGAIIIDCMTVYVGRRMHKIADDSEIIDEIVAALGAMRDSGKAVLIVSNEVGMGIVPEYPVGRRYRDLLGIVNQRIAEAADKVLFSVAGIPVDIKALGMNSVDGIELW